MVDPTESIRHREPDEAVPGNDTITGKVIGIQDCGTLAILFLDAEKGRTVPIPMDHRAFQHLLEGEGCNSEELVGRRVSYDGDFLVFLN
jgi:hypothetical protein